MYTEIYNFHDNDFHLLAKVATIILLGVPIASSILNLFMSEREKNNSRFGAKR